LPTVDLVEVIDTSGAYIPGHGTPTVTLVSRSRRPQADTIRAVLGIQGEPGAPEDPAQGLVWSSIVTHVDDAGYEDRWISVIDLSREALSSHPWSLQGGAAPKVSSVIDKSGNSLESRLNEIGFGAVTREDDVYLIGATRIRQLEAKKTSLPLVAGTDLRDWTEPDSTIAIWPYDSETLKAKLTTSTRNHLWRYRTNLSSRSAYGST